jgi:hypothetical protein
MLARGRTISAFACADRRACADVDAQSGSKSANSTRLSMMTLTLHE